MTSAPRPRILPPALLVCALVLATSCAAAPPHRKVMAEIVAAEMFLAMDSPTTSQRIARAEDLSTAARGKPGGYRQAVVIRQPGHACSTRRDPVACGGKIELFRTADKARHRVRVLSKAGGAESVHRRGALVLRLTNRLTPEQRDHYVKAFDVALAHLPDRLVEKADLPCGHGMDAGSCG